MIPLKWSSKHQRRGSNSGTQISERHVCIAVAAEGYRLCLVSMNRGFTNSTVSTDWWFYSLIKGVAVRRTFQKFLIFLYRTPLRLHKGKYNRKWLCLGETSRDFSRMDVTYFVITWIKVFCRLKWQLCVTHIYFACCTINSSAQCVFRVK